MRIKLYKPFEHWYHGGTIWVYSDPHFGDPDQKTMDYLWPDDNEQVRLINYNLGKNDTIIFLGDIGDASYIEKIKGYKVLIMGNHDKGASNYSMFNEVYEGPLMINDHVLLSHEPIDMGFGINIHGHDHVGYVFDRYLKCVSINVCSNIVDFKKQRLDYLLNSIDYVDVHRLTIDKAINRKRTKRV